MSGRSVGRRTAEAQWIERAIERGQHGSGPKQDAGHSAVSLPAACVALLGCDVGSVGAVFSNAPRVVRAAAGRRLRYARLSRQQ